MKKITSALAALALFSQAAFAHGAKTGTHGGPQTDAGSFHIEVVTEGQSLSVYMRDHSDKEVSPEGFKGTAIFVVDGKPQRITLAPDGKGLKGQAAVPLPKEPKGAVQLTTPSGGTVQGKF